MKVHPITPEEWAEYYAEIERQKRIDGQQSATEATSIGEYDPDAQYTAQEPPVDTADPRAPLGPLYQGSSNPPSLAIPEEPEDVGEYDPDATYTTTQAAAPQAPFKYEEPQAARDTTFGEKAAGIGLALGEGTIGATKSILDLADWAVPKPLEKYTTDPWIDLFQRGIDAAEALTPEAFKAKQAESLLSRNADTGKAEGLQLPSIEHATAMIAQTIPYIPSFIATGGGTSGVLAKLAPRVEKLTADLLGYGVANSALQAPTQYDETYNLAKKEGKTDAEAENAAKTSAGLVGALMFITGAAGGGVASKLGAEAKSLLGSLIKGFLGEGPFEGIEESGQNLSEDYAMGRPLDTTGALDVGLSATLLGGGPGAVIGAKDYLAGPDTTSLNALKQEFINNPIGKNVAEIDKGIGKTAINAQGATEVTDDINEPEGVQDTVNTAPVSTENLEQPVVAPNNIPITDPVTGEALPPSTAPISPEGDAAAKAAVVPPEIPTPAQTAEAPKITLSSGVGKGKTTDQLENKHIDAGIKLKEKSVTKAREEGDILAEARHNEDLNALKAEKAVRVERAKKAQTQKKRAATIAAKKAAPAVATPIVAAKAEPKSKTVTKKSAAKTEPAPVTEAPVQKAIAEKATEPVTQEHDGDKYFDKAAVEEATNQSGGSREILVHMSPDEFLAMAANAPIDKDKQTTVSGLVKSNAPLNTLPVLGFDNNGDGTASVSTHEGRHRARELKLRGVKSMPVILQSQEGPNGPAIRWQKQDEGSRDRVPDEKYPTKLLGENSNSRNVQDFPVPRPAAKKPAPTSKKTGKVAVKKVATKPAATVPTVPKPAPKVQEAPIVKPKAAVKAAPPVTSKEAGEARAAQEPEQQAPPAKKAPVKKTTAKKAEPKAKPAAKEAVAAVEKTKQEIAEEVAAKKAKDAARLKAVTRKISDLQKELTPHYLTPMAKRDKAAVAALEKKLAPLKKEQEALENPAKLQGSDDIAQAAKDLGKVDLDSPKAAAMRAAIDEGLGRFYSRLVTLVSANDPRITEGVAKGQQRRAVYDPNTGKILIAVRKDVSPELAVWLAWHELTHKGLNRVYNPPGTRAEMADADSEVAAFERRQEEYDTLMARAWANPTIKKIAQWGMKNLGYSQETAVDETLADLGAMVASKLSKPLEKTLVGRSGVAVSKGMLAGKNSTIANLLKSLANFVRKITNRAGPSALTDVEVFDLLQKARRESLNPHVGVYDLPGMERVGPFTADKGQGSDDLEDEGDGESDNKRPPPLNSVAQAAMNASREAAGYPPLEKNAHVSNEERQGTAAAQLKDDPQLGIKIGNSIVSDNNYTPSATDIAVMHLHLSNLKKTWKSLGDAAIDTDTSVDRREGARDAADLAEADIALYQERIRLGTGRAGAALQYTQAALDDDWSVANMLYKEKVRNLGVLTGERRAKIEATAAKIERQVRDVAEKARAELSGEVNEEIDSYLDGFVNEEQTKRAVHVAHHAKRALNPSGRFTKLTEKEKQSAVARWLDTHKDENAKLVAEIKATLGINKVRDVTEAMLDVVRLMPKLIKVGAYHMVKGAYDFTLWVKEFSHTLGDKIFNRLSEEQVDSIYKDALLSVQESEIAAGIKDVADMERELEASKLADDPVSHSEVWRIAKAHRMAGVKGADAIMAATTKTINKHFPDITERQVRRAFVKYGRATKPSINQITKDMAEARTIVRLAESIQRLQEGKPALKTGRGRHKDTLEIAALKRQLNAEMRKYEQAHSHGIDGRLVGINERRETALRNKIAELEEQLETGKAKEKSATVGPTDSVQRMQATAEILKLRLKEQERANNPGLAERKAEARQLARMRQQVVMLQAKIHNKDYSRPPVKPKRKPSKELRALMFELQETKSAYLLEQYMAEEKKRNRTYKLAKGTSRGIVIHRGVRTGYDVSSFGRQSALVLYAHPSLAAKVLIKQIQAASSAARAYEINTDMIESDFGQIAKSAGIFFNNPNSTNPTKQEEAYMDAAFQNSRVAKWTGLAATARAYNTGVNVARYEYFKLLYNSFSTTAKPLAQKELAHLAHWVNLGTGRGSLTFGKNAGSGGDVAASFVFFSARWVTSRLSIALGLPIWTAPTPRIALKLAREYLQSASGMLTLIALVASAFALAYPDDDIYIGTDPLSSDFLKIVMGDTRLDLTAGMSTIIVFLARLGMRAKRLATGETQNLLDDNGLLKLVGRFILSKLAPIPAIIVNTWREEDFLGNETDLSHEIADSIPPLSLQEWSKYPTVRNGEAEWDDEDWSPLLEEQGLSKALMIQMFFFLGAGGGTFDDTANSKSSRSKKAAPNIYDYMSQQGLTSH